MLHPPHIYGSGKWSMLGISHKEQHAYSSEERILHLQQSRTLDVRVFDLGYVIAKVFLEQFTKLVRVPELYALDESQH